MTGTDSDTSTPAFSACPDCGHLMLFHDIESQDDPQPTCCAENCGCGGLVLVKEASR
jgi:hypothetical protein